MLNIHPIADIIPGKRARKPPGTFTEGSFSPSTSLPFLLAKGNTQQNLPDKSHPRPVGRPSKKNMPMHNITNTGHSRPLVRKTSAPHDFAKVVESSNLERASPYLSSRGSRRKMSHASIGGEVGGTPIKKIALEQSILVPKVTKEAIKDLIDVEHDETEEEIVQTSEEIPKIATPRLKIKKNKFGSPTKRHSHRLVSKVTKGKQKEFDEKLDEGQLKKIVREVAKKEISIEDYIKVEENVVELNKEFHRVGTYVNCDLRYFNFDFLVDKLGYFDGIVTSYAYLT